MVQEDLEGTQIRLKRASQTIERALGVTTTERVMEAVRRVLMAAVRVSVS